MNTSKRTLYMSTPKRALHILTDLDKDITSLDDWYTTYQPENPFKCENILLWFPGITTIKEITIGNFQQLTIPNIPASILASPLSIEQIQSAFNCGMLDQVLHEHNVLPLMLSTIQPDQRLTLKISGYLHAMALYGTELVEIPNKHSTE